MILVLLLLWGAESAFVVDRRICRIPGVHRRPPLPRDQFSHHDVFLIGSHHRRRRRRDVGASAARGGEEFVAGRRRPLPRKETPSPTRERTVLIMYHKPPNVITSHSNADEVSASSSVTGPRRTVYDDIMSMKGYVDDGREVEVAGGFREVTGIQSKLHAIGRLDADTTGLLLLTNDGALVHRITNPNAKSNDGDLQSDASSVQKTYEAVIMGHHTLPTSTQQSASAHDDNNTEAYPLQELLDTGVALSAKHGGQTKPVDALSIISHPTRTTTRVSITISEGKNRQIRRMFHAVGSGVMKLHRVSVGGLALGGLLENGKDPRCGQRDEEAGLKEGEWRLLSEEEIRLGLGWKCRYLDEVRQSEKKTVVNSKRTRGVNGKRQNRRRR